jgi:hypothetical protein
MINSSNFEYLRFLGILKFDRIEVYAEYWRELLLTKLCFCTKGILVWNKIIAKQCMNQLVVVLRVLMRLKYFKFSRKIASAPFSPTHGG